MPARRVFRYNNIHETVKNGDVSELEAMVKSGASVNELENSRDKFTPMHWACQKGALECLHWLLWHGADTTVTTPKGWTPAHIAAIRGQDACLQALANNGANMNARDARGATPAHMSAAHGNSFTLHSILRSGVEVNSVDKIGWSPIHAAAFHGRLGCLQLLVRWGGRTDETENAGNTAAHLAAMEGNLPCLKFLVSEGPNPTHVLSARNDNGETPKMLAQQFYKETIVEYISNIEWERDHPEESENLAFPAHVAAYTGDLNHLRMLIENGIVNINERDEKGSTPAHKAAGQGHLDVLSWLIEIGANMSITNQAGETPRDVARRFAQLAAVKLLGGNQVDLELNNNLEEDHAEELPSFIEKPCNISRRKNAPSNPSRDLAPTNKNISSSVNMNVNNGNGHASMTESHSNTSSNLDNHGSHSNMTNSQSTVRGCLDNTSGTDMTSSHADLDLVSDTLPSTSNMSSGTIQLGDDDAEDRPGGAQEGASGDEGRDSDDEDGDGTSRPAAGNTDADTINMTKREIKEARGRSRKKMEELERLFEVAKRNYVQFGGRITEDRRKLKEDRDNKRTINELEAQLDYERLRRERLEAQLDEYRREMAHFAQQMDDSHRGYGRDDDDRGDHSGRRKSRPSKKKPPKESGAFIRRNVSAQRKTSNFKIV